MSAGSVTTASTQGVGGNYLDISQPAYEKDRTEYVSVEDGYHYNKSYYQDVLQVVQGNQMTAELTPDGSVVVEAYDKPRLELILGWAEEADVIRSYEVDVYVPYSEKGQALHTIDLGEVPYDSRFVVYLYPRDEEAMIGGIVERADGRYDESMLYDDYRRLDEVRRMVVMSANGQKRIKMKCRKGYIWTGHACVKLTGAQLTKKRLAQRKAVRTKKSMGAAYRNRTIKMMKKAKRYRKLNGMQ